MVSGLWCLAGYAYLYGRPSPQDNVQPVQEGHQHEHGRPKTPGGNIGDLAPIIDGEIVEEGGVVGSSRGSNVRERA